MHESDGAAGPEGGVSARSGVDVVIAGESFYVLVFAGTVIIAGLAAASALVLLPLRATRGSLPLNGLVLGGLTVALSLCGLARLPTLYAALCRRGALQVALAALAAALVSLVFPLRSQLWWPACALIMVLAVVASFRRVVGCCLAVLVCNLGAHILEGDLARTPAVAIVGLWVGFFFWSALVSTVVGQLAAYVIMRASVPGGEPPSLPPALTAGAIQSSEQRLPPPAEAKIPIDWAACPEPAHGAHREGLARLTPRELEVLALVIDGLDQRQIAACLSITTRQVRRHVSNACARAGCRSDNQLAALAVRTGALPSRLTSRPRR
jgi:DNA-binding CsgD family transcriptional regulator